MADYVVCPITLGPSGPWGRMAYRPRVADYAVVWQQQIGSAADGSPLRGWTLVRVDTWRDRVAAEADPQVYLFPQEALNRPLGARSAVVETTINTRFGCGVTLTATDTWRDVLAALGGRLDPNGYNLDGLTA